MTAETLTAMTVIAGFFFAVIAMEALRKRMLGRLAMRDAVRRPAETTLVVVGSLLGTAIITGSYIVGDTLDSSIRASATTQLGPVDETITVPETADAEAIESRIEAIEDRRIDGVVSFTAVPASLASSASGRRLAEPEAQAVELSFDEGRSFGANPEITGIAGDTPGAGEVVLTEDLAATLGVGAGDEVTAYLYGRPRHLEVTRVLPQIGLAGYWRGIESTSMNAFIDPGSIESIMDKGLPPGAEPPNTTVAVSNQGGIEDAAEVSAAVTTLIEDAIGGAANLRVEQVKKELLEEAEAQGKEFSELFLAIGSFAVVAGVLLLVNIFVMLAEERKAQLGMLRAVGMRRADLVRGFVIEGSIYALMASALGAVLGIGVGWAIVKLAAPIFGESGDFSLNLIFDADPTSILGGFFIGALISLATISFTSLRISRVNIIRAIRDLPEPKVAKSRLRTVIAGLVLAGLAALWFVTSLGNESAWLGVILGPPGAALGLVPLAGRAIGRRTAVIIASGGSLAWGIFGNQVTDGGFFEGGQVFAFVVQGVLLTFAAVILLSQTQETLEGGIRRVAARSLALRLGLAYPLARRFRTGLTLGMFSLVTFTMVFISVLSNVFGGQLDTATRNEAGDFQILVESSPSSPPSAEELNSVDGVAEVSTLVYGQALFHPLGIAEPRPWTLSGIGLDFIRNGPPPLEERAKGLSSDQDAWRKVVQDPKAAIVDIFFLQQGGGPPETLVESGDTLPIIDPITGQRTERRVVGTTSSGLSFSGVFMSKQSALEATSQAAPSRFYVTTEVSDEAAQEVTTRIQGRFIDSGVEAQTFRSLVADNQEGTLAFFDLMQGYLALGLVVGVAGLGVLMIRAVRERRREVGVLRSLGFLAGQVRKAYVLEAGFVAFEGIMVGTILALITATQLVNNGDFGEGIELVIPWSEIGVLTGAAFVASLLATAWPAQQASTIPPAVALRVAE